MTLSSRRDLAISIAFEHLGVPYRWGAAQGGGDDPILGFDCSGFISYVLRSVGKLERGERLNAAGLASKFLPAVNQGDPPPGSLLLYERTNPAGQKYIGHVEMVYGRIEGALYAIGASGGGSATDTPEEAAKDNAMVQIKPAVIGWVKAVDPFL